MLSAPETYPYSAIEAFGKVLIPAQIPPFETNVLQVLQVVSAEHPNWEDLPLHDPKKIKLKIKFF